LCTDGDGTKGEIENTNEGKNKSKHRNTNKKIEQSHELKKSRQETNKLDVIHICAIDMHYIYLLPANFSS
jgi:translation elongation factor P/translation initiation factor 5A